MAALLRFLIWRKVVTSQNKPLLLCATTKRQVCRQAAALPPFIAKTIP